MNTIYTADVTLPQRIVKNGALGNLRDAVESLACRRLLLVQGVSSFRQSAFHSQVRNILEQCAVVECPAVKPNPTVNFLAECISLLQRENVDIVVGIGGGSVLDVAKGLAFHLGQTEREAAFCLDGVANGVGKGLPMIAIPTTAGSGSEATPYASLVTAENKKISLDAASLIPRVSLVDPLLTWSLPAYETAASGFDALCQCVEAFWSRRATPSADQHSLEAIPLICASLRRAVGSPRDSTARYNMALASFKSGLAISETRTTAVHSVSYPLTSLFGIPHGHACALTLSSFIRYNAPSIDQDRASKLWAAFGQTSADEAASFVERLMEDVGLERRLARLGVDGAAIHRIVAEGFRPDRVRNNPRSLDPESCLEILESIS